MKKYHLFATLSFAFISFLIEMMMSAQAGFNTFAGFNWFLSKDLLSTNQILIWLGQGIALSFAAFLYINKKNALLDGFRFGLITGLLFILLALFNLMFQLDNSHYAFLASSLLPLSLLQLIGFCINGWIFGLLFEMFSPELPTNKSLWSLA